MAGRKPTTRRETERQSMYMRDVRARAILNTNWRIKTGSFLGYLNRKSGVPQIYPELLNFIIFQKYKKKERWSSFYFSLRRFLYSQTLRSVLI